MTDPGMMIETPRLRLREFHLDDAAAMHAMNADPEVLRFTGDVPFASLEEARAFLLAYDQYRTRGMGRWVMEEKQGGAFVGWCGLKYDPDIDEVDLGFRLPRAVWGRGYATEAGRACLEYGFGKLGLRRIVGRAMADNASSHRVLMKLSMVEVERKTDEGAMWVIYEVTR